MPQKIFAAYPAKPEELSQAITTASLRDMDGRWVLRTWQSLFSPGNFIDNIVLKSISTADVLLCDITVPNQNVFFEIGYAIALGKPIIPIRNVSISGSGSYLTGLGIIDVVGYLSYENGEDLAGQLKRHVNPEPLFQSPSHINRKQPVFVLDAYRRSEFAAKIISSVKDQIKFFRSFDPQEDYRLSMRSAWEHVSQSTGVVVSLLAPSKDDSENHNIRASFLAGLATGLNKEVLILVDGSSADTPLDFREACRSVRHPDDIAAQISAFGVRALSARLEDGGSKQRAANIPLLRQVSVGSAAAENEFRSLERYYVDTAEFKAALDGRGRLVIGRKGSGKTAIFWRVRDVLREKHRKGLVVDLKPDGYQLRKFKEQLISLLSSGTKEHTLTALWEFIIYSELLHKIFEDDSRLVGRDLSVTERLEKLRPAYEEISRGREGDFSERMMGVLSNIAEEFVRMHGKGTRDKFLTTEQVTNLLHIGSVANIESIVLDYLSYKERTVVLVDNIDKGWGAHGVDPDDTLIVITLMDAMRKIERQASKRNVPFDWLLLLRSDVYELLVEDQNDRGKEDKIVVDWDSPAALKEVINKRIRVSTQRASSPNGASWADVAVDRVEGSESLDWVVARSLMRPRYLIQLVHECLGHAVTAGKTEITEEDFLEGYRVYSLDIIGNTNFELRDVFPPAYDAIYALIGGPRKRTLGEVKGAMTPYVDGAAVNEIIKLFFWHAVLGTVTPSGEEKYIYNYRYDRKIFEKVRQTNLGDAEPVVINHAFARGLDCF